MVDADNEMVSKRNYGLKKENKFMQEEESVHRFWERTYGKRNTLAPSLDVDGWKLWFCDYLFVRWDETPCKDIPFKESKVVQGQDFVDKVMELNKFFMFNPTDFIKVYEYQHDLEAILRQCIQKQFRRNKTGRFCKIVPDREVVIPTPKISLMCRSLSFPLVVTEAGEDIKVERVDVDAFGDGDFVTIDGEIIDCVRINDFWLTDEPFSLRKKFLGRAKKESKEYYICWNFKHMREAVMMIGKPDILCFEVSQTPENYNWFRLCGSSWYLGNSRNTFPKAYNVQRDNIKLYKYNLDGQRLTKNPLTGGHRSFDYHSMNGLRYVIGKPPLGD